MKSIFFLYLIPLIINTYKIVSKSIINCEIANINGESILISDINEISNFLEQSNAEHIDKAEILEQIITNKILKKYCEKKFNNKDIKKQIEMQMKLVREGVENHTLKILSEYFKNDRKAFYKETGQSVSDFINTNIKAQKEQIFISLAMQSLSNNNSLDFSPKKIVNYNFNKDIKNSSTNEELYEICELVVDNIVQKEKIEDVNKIYKEILNDKNNFEKIIDKYSDEDINIGEIDILKDNYPFNHVLLKLNKNEISEIIETDNAFYIIKWTDKKNNTNYKVVGLTILKDNVSNYSNIKTYLENIKSDIENKKISWEDAVLKYSTNKKNKNYSGVILNNENTELINKDYLSTKEYDSISKMKEGEISNPIECIDTNCKKVYKILLLKKKYSATTDKKQYDLSNLINSYNKEKTMNKIQNIKKNILKNSTLILDKDFEICKKWDEKYNKN